MSILLLLTGSGTPVTPLPGVPILEASGSLKTTE
jgi:hypothetical protein